MKQAVRLPEFVRRRRDARATARLNRDREPSWFFQQAPQANCDWFLADLAQLCRKIKESGAQPVLLTHAVRCHTPPDADDLIVLEQMRMFVARATAPAMAEFESLVRTRMKAQAADEGWKLIDVGGSLSGRPDLFADLVHFNDAGAAEMATQIARGLESILPAERRDGS
jgi:lysophospholipase L1-like esterase